jgi:uncharacterized protein YjlB
MSKPINRRQFATGIVAAGVAGRALASSPQAATPEQLHLKPNGWMPNSTLPVLIYRNALPVTANNADALADTMEHLFTANGWPPQWRNGVYSFHHYHSTAHEVLGFAGGYADLVLGGEGGTPVAVHAGDIAVLPAGTGHCRITASEDFLVVGAYPAGEHWDICRTAATPEVLERMRHVKFPASDPLTGPAGALPKLWTV